MKRSSYLILLSFFLASFNSLSQGGWNIGYIQIDSLTQTDIGKDVKVDFAKNSQNLMTGINSVRFFISNEDTVKLSINGEAIELIEHRFIHCDWGFYDEQYLECSNYSAHETLRIYNTVIEEIKPYSVKFRFYIEIYGKDKKHEVTTILRRRCESVEVQKSALNGVMIKL